MTHRSMVAIADGLEGLGVARSDTSFPTWKRAAGARTGRPWRTPQCAAATQTRLRGEGLRLFAGGRSFGGRMTSQAQALEPLEGGAGLVFFALPLHPAAKPSVSRAEHLSDVAIPMLFLQGSNDSLAEIDLLRQTVPKLADRATLDLIADADHTFHVPAKTRRKAPIAKLRAAAKSTHARHGTIRAPANPSVA
jgi:predicted alpha/beta-hydrolase family hydrolase